MALVVMTMVAGQDFRLGLRNDWRMQSDASLRTQRLATPFASPLTDNRSLIIARLSCFPTSGPCCLLGRVNARRNWRRAGAVDCCWHRNRLPPMLSCQAGVYLLHLLARDARELVHVLDCQTLCWYGLEHYDILVRC